MSVSGGCTAVSSRLTSRDERSLYLERLGQIGRTALVEGAEQDFSPSKNVRNKQSRSLVQET